jgi:predicted nuclease with RNAse H fold
VRLVGLHLLQPLDLVASARRSALAEVDGSGRLLRLELLGGDDEILAALPSGPALVAVDAPLAVPDETGQRDLERVLSWCDVPVFPVSRRRLQQVFGGARGVALAARLADDGRTVVETLPDLVLRQLGWERRRPQGAPPLDLAEYRAAWLSVRAPAYRPKAAGRARPAGLAPARALLAGVLDLEGWAPAADPDDWTALHDAARLDALACACLALRAHRDAASLTAVIGSAERGRVVVAADDNLRHRIAVNLARLRGEGTIRI